MKVMKEYDNYQEFIKTKQIYDKPSGHEPENINSKLFDFQKDITGWSIRRGRAALWEDCGLGKTPQQLEWANQVHNHTNKPILTLAPLAVSKQTVNEGKKFGIDVNLCKSQDDVTNGINITNYEKLHNFNPSEFVGIVLDESSILKGFASKTRQQIIEMFNNTPYRLACTATPAPNDFMELANHAEFLGVMSRSEMLSTFFIHDSKETQKWRLKGHAQDEFWKWICSWAVMIRKPSDLGYDDGNFKLPELKYHNHIIKVDKPTDGFLFVQKANTLNERRQARRSTLKERVNLTADIVNNTDEQFLIWCDLNSESEMLTKQINGAIEIAGRHKDEHKENAMLDFQKGNIKILVTKPQIAGHGINWQNCHNMAFVGLSDSFERFYQAVRRCWRFGQDKPVNVHIVTAETEGSVLDNIKRKESDSLKMAQEMVQYMSDISKKNIQGISRKHIDYIPQDDMVLPNWL